MNNRAEDGLALLAEHQDWVESNPGNLATRASYRLARSSIYAFGDRLAEAIAEGRLALAASSAAQDWPNALPAMSNLGVMHYWRGEYAAAHEVLASARAQRERLYGGGGAGIKIDIHLGGVLYELGRFDEARSLLEGALEQLRGMPPSEYIRTDALLVENHLAQLAIAGGQPEAAAAALASDTAGLAERFVGRRLALRLRWQRSFADQVDAALVTELQALVARLASPFNRALMALELARLLPPDQALTEYSRHHDSPVALARPGLQLHAAAMAADAAGRAGLPDAARDWALRAKALAERCGPFDLSALELSRVLGRLLGRAATLGNPPTAIG